MKRSTTMITFLPRYGGRLSIKSMLTDYQAKSCMGSGLSKAEGWFASPLSCIKVGDKLFDVKAHPEPTKAALDAPEGAKIARMFVS